MSVTPGTGELTLIVTARTQANRPQLIQGLWMCPHEMSIDFSPLARHAQKAILLSQHVLTAGGPGPEGYHLIFNQRPMRFKEGFELHSDLFEFPIFLREIIASVTAIGRHIDGIVKQVKQRWPLEIEVQVRDVIRFMAFLVKRDLGLVVSGEPIALPPGHLIPTLRELKVESLKRELVVSIEEGNRYACLASGAKLDLSGLDREVKPGDCLSGMAEIVQRKSYAMMRPTEAHLTIWREGRKLRTRCQEATGWEAAVSSPPTRRSRKQAPAQPESPVSFAAPMAAAAGAPNAPHRMPSGKARRHGRLRKVVPPVAAPADPTALDGECPPPEVSLTCG